MTQTNPALNGAHIVEDGGDLFGEAPLDDEDEDDETAIVGDEPSTVGGGGGPGLTGSDIDRLGGVLGGIGGALGGFASQAVVGRSRFTIGQRSASALRGWFNLFFTRFAANLRRAGRIIKLTAPRDTGRLKRSIRVITRQQADGGFLVSAEMIFYGRFVRRGAWFREVQRAWASTIPRAARDAAAYANART